MLSRRTSGRWSGWSRGVRHEVFGLRRTVQLFGCQVLPPFALHRLSEIFTNPSNLNFYLLGTSMRTARRRTFGSSWDEAFGRRVRRLEDKDVVDHQLESCIAEFYLVESDPTSWSSKTSLGMLFAELHRRVRLYLVVFEYAWTSRGIGATGLVLGREVVAVWGDWPWHGTEDLANTFFKDTDYAVRVVSRWRSP